MGSGASAPASVAHEKLTRKDKIRIFNAAASAIREIVHDIKDERSWDAQAEELLPKLAEKKYADEKVLLWISDGIMSWPLAAKAVKDGVLALVYAAKEQNMLEDDIVASLKAAEVPEGSLTNVGWMFHGSEMTGKYKEANLKFLAALKPYLAEAARVDILGCDMVATKGSMEVFNELETECGINLAASTDLTGNADNGGNWILETDGVNVKDLYFTDAINAFSETLGLRSMLGMGGSGKKSKSHRRPRRRGGKGGKRRGGHGKGDGEDGDGGHGRRREDEDMDYDSDSDDDCGDKAVDDDDMMFI
mmetsp:Transcript_63133/g.148291  ORF Transcript_63133/g.148291 Transcript_63133/m.148291 type:complete len:305 (-) Transcript_63133:323-1237(-)